jgi:hypothetical protein
MKGLGVLTDENVQIELPADLDGVKGLNEDAARANIGNVVLLELPDAGETDGQTTWKPPEPSPVSSH